MVQVVIITPALYCLNSNYNGFSDWYLPSIREADSIYVNLRATVRK